MGHMITLRDVRCRDCNMLLAETVTASSFPEARAETKRLGIEHKARGDCDRERFEKGTLPTNWPFP